MSAGIFAIVIAAALLHAVWNALVKGGADKTAAMAAVVIGQGLAGVAILPFTPFPAAEGWPFLWVGILLHMGYQVFLVWAYRNGDLTQVYPIARGASPLIVTLVSVFWLGEKLSPLQQVAIGLIAGGIWTMALARRPDGGLQGKAALLALITGGFIAGYSLVDGAGARLAGTALGYYAWLSVLNGIGFTLVLLLLRPVSVQAALRLPTSLFLGGTASFVAYAMVVYAFTQAPIALVTALRETSVIFAMVIGVLFLSERLSPIKLLAVAASLSGAILLRLGG